MYSINFRFPNIKHTQIVKPSVYTTKTASRQPIKPAKIQNQTRQFENHWTRTRTTLENNPIIRAIIAVRQQRLIRPGTGKTTFPRGRLNSVASDIFPGRSRKAREGPLSKVDSWRRFVAVDGRYCRRLGIVRKC